MTQTSFDRPCPPVRRRRARRRRRQELTARATPPSAPSTTSTSNCSRGEFTAIMGPSGSGKSTLMHCLAGLDSVTSGSVAIGDVELPGLSDKKMTALRRDRIGFVFQSFNLVPTLTALENITLPIGDRRPRARPRVARHGDRHPRPARPARPPPERAVRRPAAARGRRPGPGRPARHHLRRRADRQPRLALQRRGAAASCASRSTTSARPSSSSPTTRARPSYADRVLFLADGRIVDELRAPTADTVLDTMKQLERRRDASR